MNGFSNWGQVIPLKENRQIAHQHYFQSVDSG